MQLLSFIATSVAELRIVQLRAQDARSSAKRFFFLASDGRPYLGEMVEAVPKRVVFDDELRR